MKFIVLFTIFLFAAQSVHGRVFSKCELAWELRGHGFPQHLLPDWICLVQSESSGDSTAVGGPNTDGSYDWGLFQINDRYWCGVGHNAGECNANCYDFLQDDIYLSSICAQQIFNIHGFDAWYGWQAKCRNQPLPDLWDCGL